MCYESHHDTLYFTSEVFPMDYVVYHKDISISDEGVFIALKDNLTLSCIWRICMGQIIYSRYETTIYLFLLQTTQFRFVTSFKA